MKYIKYLSILVLRMTLFFCQIMYLPCCSYTPGEYVFLCFCVCSFNARQFSQPGDTIAHSGSERKVVSSSLKNESDVRFLFLFFLFFLGFNWSEQVRSAERFNSWCSVFIGDPLGAPALSLLCSSSLVNSGFVHLLCCVFVSTAKERRLQAPGNLSVHTYLFINAQE